MPDRYFVETPIHGERALLTGSEVHHLAKVLRARPGDSVTLFDGSGAEFSAVIERIARHEVELAITGRREIDREAARDVTLAVALPKGERQQWLVEKLTELGVRRLVPLETERGVAQATEATLTRLRRAVVEASKQCGRNRLLEITPAQDWERVAHAAGNAERWLAHPEFRDAARFAPGAAALLVAIGPEGGWTENELALGNECGWRRLWLGNSILRVETAAIMAAAWALA